MAGSSIEKVNTRHYVGKFTSFSPEKVSGRRGGHICVLTSRRFPVPLCHAAAEMDLIVREGEAAEGVLHNLSAYFTGQMYTQMAGCLFLGRRG